MIVIGGDYHLSRAKQALERRTGDRVRAASRRRARAVEGLAEDGTDLVVGSAFAFGQVRRGRKWLEFGYPSEETHFLRREPFLGFRALWVSCRARPTRSPRGLNQERDDG